MVIFSLNISCKIELDWIFFYIKCNSCSVKWRLRHRWGTFFLYLYFLWRYSFLVFFFNPQKVGIGPNTLIWFNVAKFRFKEWLITEHLYWRFIILKRRIRQRIQRETGREKDHPLFEFLMKHWISKVSWPHHHQVCTYTMTSLQAGDVTTHKRAGRAFYFMKNDNGNCLLERLINATPTNRSRVADIVVLHGRVGARRI